MECFLIILVGFVGRDMSVGRWDGNGCAAMVLHFQKTGKGDRKILYAFADANEAYDSSAFDLAQGQSSSTRTGLSLIAYKKDLVRVVGDGGVRA